MSGTPFHQTRMGHQFYEATIPALVRELARLNANLERLLLVVESHGAGLTDTDSMSTTTPARDK